jgi:hypothetical protein
LEEYTSIENVRDVECRSCTYRREVAVLEEEESLVEKGIDALVSRARKSRVAATMMTVKSGGNDCNETEKALDPAKPLRDELDLIKFKLRALRSVSPDDDDAMEQVVATGTRQPQELDDREAVSSPSSALRVDRRDAFKCLLLTRLPAVLCIHVQRRFYDPETLRASKTAQHVIFPEVLDVGPYCAYGGGGFTNVPPRVGERNPARCPAMIPYRLMSVIEHRGGAFSGHYVTYRRDPSSLNGSDWLIISDARVCRVSWKDVRHCQAYMLFYESIM